MSTPRRSRWAPRQPDELPQTAEEYEAWFRKEVERVKPIPLAVYRPMPVSAWQIEGMRLVMEKRRRQKEDAERWGF